ncbi:unnamed protein product, partial [Brassica oleracea var. botrytis]
MLTSHYETDNSHLSTFLEDEFSEDESEPFICECHRLTDDKLTLKARSWVMDFKRVSRRSTRVFPHGVGREGLMMKAFAMCPFHLGHLRRDHASDLISRSPHRLRRSRRISTVDAICSVAKSCGVKVVLITAQPER